MNIYHIVSSTEQASAGPSYSVPALLSGQMFHGSTGSICTLDMGLPAYYPEVPRRCFSRYGNSVGPIRRLGCSPELKRELLTMDFDVVHAHGLWQFPTIYAVSAARTLQRPSVIAPRGMLSDVALSYSPKKKAVFGKLFQNEALSAAKAFHATAESELDDIRAFGLKQPVCLIPNGVDIPVVSGSKIEKVSREILTLGRIHPKKGIDVLVRAWARIADRYPSWSLRIVGPDEGGHLFELQTLVKTLEVPRISFSEPLYGDEKVQAYASADVFVLPTLSENFAMTVAESLAAGTPVICTKGAPWSALNDENCGWWIDHGVDALVDKLEQVLAMPGEELEEMGERGRSWMQREFSWQSFGEKSLEFYSWLLGRGPVPDFVDI